VRPSAIIFDFGGVVVHWDPRLVYRRFLESDEAISRFFKEVGFYAWNLEQDRGRPWPDAVRELSSQFPHHHDLIRAYDQFWEDSVSGPIEGTVRILERLHAAEYRLIGLTNWSSEKFRMTQKRYDLFRLFDDIIVSGEVGHVKPDQEIFDLTLRKIGCRAEECLFVDDSAKNVTKAVEMGFQTIQFQSPEQLAEQLKMMDIL
jgi:2-haloacid dehalogenase